MRNTYIGVKAKKAKERVLWIPREKPSLPNPLKRMKLGC